MKIVQLDSSVFNKIAAGEVVERPASVVKELVENSIDAGAKHIEVKIIGGGLEFISVSDDGCGIEKADVKTAFLPHATSKLKTADDLRHISTLGFRGEALPSIASISMITLISKTEESDFATKVSIRGGVFESEEVCSAPTGTTIEVKNLFFNTPARLKFMKTPAGEANDVRSTMMKIIFANPQISFDFSDENGKIYSTHGEGEAACIRSIFGKDLFENLIPFYCDRNNIKASGFCSKSTYFKSNRTYQIFMVNGRVATNDAFTNAVSTVYAGYLMKRNYPVIVLNLEIDPSEVDVNVHPTKAEVRFSDKNAVFSSIYHGIKDALDKDISERKIAFNTICDETEQVINQDSISSEFNSINSNDAYEDKTSSINALFSKNYDDFSDNSSIFAQLDKKNKQSEENIIVTNAIQEVSPNVLPAYRIIGQLFGTYILLEYGDKFILIDQHAAMERIRYEHLLCEYKNNAITVQPMLVPMILDLLPSEYEIVEGKIPMLKSIGIEIEPFGGYSFKLTAIPAILASLDLNLLLRDILSERSIKDENVVIERLMYAACRSSIKGNTYLSNEEISDLMKMFKDGLPVQCPHGRPAFVVYSKNEVEKMFKRIV